MNVDLAKIRLVPVDFNSKDAIDVQDLMTADPELSEIFAMKKTRLLASIGLFLIKYKNKNVGFVNLVNEGPSDFGFVDMGILPDYRGNGIGKVILKQISQMNLDFFLIGETKDRNKAANKIMDGLGIKVAEVTKLFKTAEKEVEVVDKVFYLLPESRHLEYVAYGANEELINHINKGIRRNTEATNKVKVKHVNE